MAAAQSSSSEEVSSSQQQAALEEFRQRWHNEFGCDDKRPLAAKRFETEDISRAETEDWWLLKFLERYEYDIDVAFPCFIEALKWRKEHDANCISVLKIKPSLEKQVMYIRGVNKDDETLLWFNARNHKKNQLDPSSIQSLTIYWLERHFMETKGTEPLVIIFDMSSTGIQNMDLDFVRFMLNCLKFYYPEMLAHLLVVEIPWVLNAAWRIVKSWLDPAAQKKIIFVDKKGVRERIALDQLPLHLGGSDDYHLTMAELGRPISPHYGSVDRNSDSVRIDYGEANSVNGESEWQRVDDSMNVSLSSANTSQSPTSGAVFDTDIEYRMAVANGSADQFPKRRSVKFMEDEPVQRSAPLSVTSKASSGMANGSPQFVADTPPTSATTPTSPVSSTQSQTLHSTLLSNYGDPAATVAHESHAETGNISQSKNDIGHRRSQPSRLQHVIDERRRDESAWNTGSFVAISPKEELSLRRLEGEVDKCDAILLRNLSSAASSGGTAVSFKVKTTSPEKFRVRPSYGEIAPGESTLVKIYVQQEYAEKTKISRDKFLVMTIKHENIEQKITQDRFAAVWKAAVASPVVTTQEFRLRCRVVDTPADRIIQESARLNGSLPSAKYALNSDQSADNEMSAASLRHKLSRVQLENRLMMAVLALLFVWVAIVFYRQNAALELLTDQLSSLRSEGSGGACDVATCNKP